MYKRQAVPPIAEMQADQGLMDVSRWREPNLEEPANQNQGLESARKPLKGLIGRVLSAISH
jgi:hypothetical protein